VAVVVLVVVVRVRKIELFYDRPVGFAYIVIYYYYYDVINEAGNCAGLVHRVTVTTKAIKNENKKIGSAHDPRAKSPRDCRKRVPTVCILYMLYVPTPEIKKLIIFSGLYIIFVTIRVIIHIIYNIIIIKLYNTYI